MIPEVNSLFYRGHRQMWREPSQEANIAMKVYDLAKRPKMTEWMRSKLQLLHRPE